MSYKINYTNVNENPLGITVEDQSINTDTSLVFVGKNYPGYSQFIGENFLHLLENFSGPSEPLNGVKGQLWYDSINYQLKVYDGQNWTEASSVKKSTTKPATGLLGDLWVDTINQQVYIYTGSSGEPWSLVGPQTVESANTGFKIELFLDSASNLNKPVISFFVEGRRIAILSNYEFLPREILEGFSTIKPGINLTSINNNYKIWGISEKASALIVANSTVTASNFLRNDITSTTNYPFNVRTSSGIKIGSSLETEITSGDIGTLVTQTSQNRIISFRTTESGTGVINRVLTVADKKVGINKDPEVALDVSGVIRSSLGLITTSDTDSASSNTGSIVTSGGAGIAKSLTVGNNINVLGKITVGLNQSNGDVVLVPATNNIHDIGKYNLNDAADVTNKRFRNIYAQNMYADTFVGSFTGNLSGNIQGSALSLTSKRVFSMSGDVTVTNPSVEREFDGTSNVTFVTAINDAFITSKSSTIESIGSDEFLIYRQAQGSTVAGLRRVTKNSIFSKMGTMPIGTVVPFAGIVCPSGFLFCDGSEVRKDTYAELFNIIKNTYNGAAPLKNNDNFRLPDLRGRFGSGRRSMNNELETTIVSTAFNAERIATSEQNITDFKIDNANYTAPGQNPWSENQFFQPNSILLGTGITDADGNVLNPTIISVIKNNDFTIVKTIHLPTTVVNAVGLTIYATGTVSALTSIPSTEKRNPGTENLGAVGGEYEKIIEVQNLPDHTHDLKDSSGNQYYAVNNSPLNAPQGVEDLNIHFEYETGLAIPNSGGVDSSTLGQPLNTLDPFLTINYIIYTGR